MAAFAPEVISNLGPLPLTNTFLHTLLVDVILIGTSLYISRKIKIIPQGFQNIIEALIEAFYNLTETIASKEAVVPIFSYAMSFFLFIFVANFTGLLPGIGTIGFYHGKDFVPLFRSATSDINVTFGLAIVSVFATHLLSIQITGFKDYISRYISLNPINLYVGLLELVAEVTKVISLSFRLFGNIFAGEVVLSTMAKIFAFVAPLPFLLLESIVSIVQALVFSILTLVFMSVLTTPHHAHEKQKGGLPTEA